LIKFFLFIDIIRLKVRPFILIPPFRIFQVQSSGKPCHNHLASILEKNLEVLSKSQVSRRIYEVLLLETSQQGFRQLDIFLRITLQHMQSHPLSNLFLVLFIVKHCELLHSTCSIPDDFQPQITLKKLLLRS
jgi:hypothetical protein